MVAVVGLSAGTGKDGSPRYGIFPDARVADPRRAQGFPYELREDAGHLPRFTGNARAFRGELEERALEDERRLFYVAITRAKQLLVLTSAWWYQGSEKTPKGPGPFWSEAADHPAVDVLVQAEQPAASPLTERLRDRVSWPHPGRRPEDEDDPVFPEGLAEAVELEQAAPGTLEARVPPGQADAFRAAAEAGQHLLDAARVDPTPARVEPPRILSVSQVLDYARCPRDFYWSVVRPLPSAPKPAARLGTGGPPPAGAAGPQPPRPAGHRRPRRRPPRRPRRPRADRTGHPQLRGHPLRHPSPTRRRGRRHPPHRPLGGPRPHRRHLPPGRGRGAGSRGSARPRSSWWTGRPASGSTRPSAGWTSSPSTPSPSASWGGSRGTGAWSPTATSAGRSRSRDAHPRAGRPRPAASPGGGRPRRPRQGRLPARLRPPRLRDLPPRPRPPTPTPMTGGGRPGRLRDRLSRALPVAMKARDRWP